MENNPVPIALRISLLYAFLASLWFLLADYLLERVVTDSRLLLTIESVKGGLFVLATALLSFFLLERELRRWQHTESRLKEIESLQRVSTALLRQHTLDDLLEIVCKEVQQLSGASSVRIILVDEAERMGIMGQQGEAGPDLERLPLTQANLGLGDLPQMATPFDSDGAAPPSPSTSALTSRLTLPLVSVGATIGVLHAIGKPGGFSENDKRLLSLLADQAALAIANARLHEQAKQAAVLEERNRLARELHDSVTQALYSIVLYADATRLALAAGKQPVASENLAELRQMARQAMADMRLLLFRLHPPQLESEGLVSALQARLNAVEARAGLRIDFQVDGRSSLPLVIEEELYRIAQEALNNVVRHARAEQVTVKLLFAEQHCTLMIQDDGVGFDPAAAQYIGGVGLQSIRERVTQIGGNLSIESEPGRGTTIRVQVPWTQGGQTEGANEHTRLDCR